MDERLKKPMTYFVVSTFGLAALSPGLECGREQMCAVENPDMWHTHQEKPEPVSPSTISAGVTVTLTSSAAFYTLLSQAKGNGSIFFKK